MGLLGSADQNLRALERTLNAELHVRGNAVTIWNAATARPHPPIKCESAVFCLVLSPDGKTLAVGDANKLKRDPSLAVTDISFADGVMWFLGVKTEQGGVALSVLQRP